MSNATKVTRWWDHPIVWYLPWLRCAPGTCPICDESRADALPPSPPEPQ